MKVNFLLCAGLMLSLGFFSCKVSEKQNVSEEPVEVSIIPVDTVFVKEEQAVEIKLYKGERTRHFKLIHTKLEISFDWENQYLHGKATLIIEPYFYSQSNIILDAKGFNIHEIELVTGDNIEKLNYVYDGNKISWK